MDDSALWAALRRGLAAETARELCFAAAVRLVRMVVMATPADDASSVGLSSFLPSL